MCVTLLISRVFDFVLACFREYAFADVGNLDHCAKYLNQTLVTYGFPASLDLFASDPVSFRLDSFGFFFALIQSKLMFVFFVFLGFDREDLQLYILVASAEAARC